MTSTVACGVCDCQATTGRMAYRIIGHQAPIYARLSCPRPSCDCHRPMWLTLALKPVGRTLSGLPTLDPT